MSGKGDTRRPKFISYQEFSNNWNKIFGKKLFICNRCEGEGEEPGAPIDLELGKALCMDCKGSGYIDKETFNENKNNLRDSANIHK